MEGIHLRKGKIATLALVLLLGVVMAGCATDAKLHPCNPVPNTIAVCLHGDLSPLTGRVIEQQGEYYAPIDDLATVLGATIAMTPDQKQITVNRKNLASTNGITNRLERDGKLYLLILDAANAAGYSVALDFQRHTVNILK